MLYFATNMWTRGTQFTPQSMKNLSLDRDTVNDCWQLALHFVKFNAATRGAMPVLENSSALLVRCANCRRQLDVNKHILKPSDEWPEDRVHHVSRTEGFVGTVGCHECGHFTMYTPS